MPNRPRLSLVDAWAAAPPAARLIAALAPLPFVIAAGAMWMGPPWLKLTAYVHVINYGALAVAFLGAIHWGLVMAAPRDRRADADTWRWYALGAGGLAAGWLALALVQPVPRIGVLAAAFTALFLADRRSHGAGIAPDWYAPLRKALTLAVLVALGAILVAIWRTQAAS